MESQRKKVRYHLLFPTLSFCSSPSQHSFWETKGITYFVHFSSLTKGGEAPSVLWQLLDDRNVALLIPLHQALFQDHNGDRQGGGPPSLYCFALASLPSSRTGMFCVQGNSSNILSEHGLMSHRLTLYTNSEGWAYVMSDGNRQVGSFYTAPSGCIILYHRKPFAHPLILSRSISYL